MVFELGLTGGLGFEPSVGIMAHYWNGGYTIGIVAILLKMWLTI